MQNKGHDSSPELYFTHKGQGRKIMDIKPRKGLCTPKPNHIDDTVRIRGGDQNGG